MSWYKSISIIPQVGKNIFPLSKFLDFDKDGNMFYDNLYLKEHDYVVKIPLLSHKKLWKKIRLEKFNLAKYTYLLDYD